MNAQEFKEYDQRQIKLMQQKIEEYNNKKINLRTLIDDLDALLDCLATVTEEWKNKFSKSWSTLEIVYACALYDNKQSPDSKDFVAIEKSLNEIKELLKFPSLSD